MEDFSNYSKEEYYQYVNIQLTQIDDILCLFLKAQIITEFTLNRYLQTIPSLQSSGYSSNYFSFKQKIEMARDFSSLHDQGDEIMEALFLLNEIKSDIVETLTIQKNKIVLFINLVQKVKNKHSSLFRNFKISELAEAFSELSSNIFQAGTVIMSEN